MNRRLWIMVVILMALSDELRTQVWGQDATPAIVATVDELKLPNGQIDYLGMLHSQLKIGVTPDNNAVVRWLEILGPRVLREVDQNTYLQELGLSEFPVGQALWVSMSEHETKEGIIERSVKQAKFRKILMDATVEPWTAEQHPELARWVAANELGLAAIEEACQRPRYFMPLVPTVPQDAGQPTVRVFSISFELVQECREIVRLLAIRSMLRLGENDIDAAIQDCQTIRRLANLMLQSLSTIEMLTAIALHGQARGCEIALLSSGKLTSEQCDEYLKFLNRLPFEPHIDLRVRIYEKYFFLDVVQTLQLGENVDMNIKIDISELDVAEIVKAGDLYDSLADLWQEPNPLTRLQNAGLMESKIVKLSANSRHINGIGAAFLSTKRRSQNAGNHLATFLAPTCQAIVSAEVREQTSRDVLQLAFAIEKYRLEHGEFPPKLKALQPNYVMTLSLDRYGERPLVYRPSASGYQLYSIGPNQVDDRGKTKNDSEEADDWGITIEQ